MEKEEEKHSEGDHGGTELDAASERSVKTGRSRSHSVASIAASKHSVNSVRKRSASVPPEPQKAVVAGLVAAPPVQEEQAPPNVEVIEGETEAPPTRTQKAQKEGGVVHHQQKTKNTPALKSLAVPVVPVDEFDPRYPHLRRRFLPTYRGRPLRHEAVNGVPRFVDDLGVFVGKLVKEKETEETIFRRFSKYGRIVSYSRFVLRAGLTEHSVVSSTDLLTRSPPLPRQGFCIRRETPSNAPSHTK